MELLAEYDGSKTKKVETDAVAYHDTEGGFWAVDKYVNGTIVDTTKGLTEDAAKTKAGLLKEGVAVD